MICDELTKDMNSGLILATAKGKWDCSGTHRTARKKIEDILYCGTCTLLSSRRGFDYDVSHAKSPREVNQSGHMNTPCPQKWINEMIRSTRPGIH
eukprot:10092611-Heterocapsa_arctica.AAC.1